MVDTFLFLTLARTGDSLQGMKRGILELADVIGVNKADEQHQDGSEKAARELSGARCGCCAGRTTTGRRRSSPAAACTISTSIASGSTSDATATGSTRTADSSASDASSSSSGRGRWSRDRLRRPAAHARDARRGSRGRGRGARRRGDSGSGCCSHRGWLRRGPSAPDLSYGPTDRGKALRTADATRTFVLFALYVGSNEHAIVTPAVPSSGRSDDSPTQSRRAGRRGRARGDRRARDLMFRRRPRRRPTSTAVSPTTRFRSTRLSSTRPPRSSTTTTR